MTKKLTPAFTTAKRSGYLETAKKIMTNTDDDVEPLLPPGFSREEKEDNKTVLDELGEHFSIDDPDPVDDVEPLLPAGVEPVKK